jgi:uncharacterized protein YbjT (DUF2867 family)
MTELHSPPRALVFGASGYIGTNLVPHLQAAGWRVRAAARNRKVLEARQWPAVDLVRADALHPKSLVPALQDIDVAYYLVHSMAAGSNFGAIDLKAAQNFAQAAAESGVRRIVYLGGLVPPDAQSEHLVSRAQTGDALRAGSVPVTEVRAGIIVGPGSAAYEVIRDLVNHLPVMLTPKWVYSKSSPIALANLLTYMERVALLDVAQRQIYDVAGPETLSYADLMLQYGDIVGKRPKIVPVPVLTPKLSSYWLALVTAVPASIGSALIGGLKHDIPADSAAIEALVPQRLLTFKESVHAALQAERQHTVAARWTEGAFGIRLRHDNAYYAKKASGSAIARATQAQLWPIVCSLGGETGYFYGAPLWQLRAWMDWAVGGPGLSKGRRHPTELRVGDRVDYWTVLGMEPERLLSLHFGMRAPGAGVMEIELEPLDEGHTRVTITAYWHPAGVWGLSYWYALVPAHLFIFDGMAKEIAKRAAQATRNALPSTA